jgi:hypothetical protein
LIDISLTSFSRDVEIIITAFKSFNPISIILYGGYGRNEGSWVENKDNTYSPYNDYDILLIVNKRIPKETIDTQRKIIGELIDIRWIDIDQKTVQNLQRSKLSIFNYDLKYGSKVIYGDTNILSVCPDFKPNKIPLIEGEKLFFTRLWTFLGSLDQDGFKDKIRGDKSRFFRNQMAKAILAVVDVLLLQKGLYHTSYKSRVERVSKHFPDKKDLVELANWALEEKLYPKSPVMSEQDTKKLYNKVHEIFRIEMYALLSKYYHINVDSPNKIEFVLKWWPKNLINRIITFSVNKNMVWERRIAIFSAQCFIFEAWDHTKKEYLVKGIQKIKICDPTFSVNSSWDEARIKISQIRMTG